jgi:hypothetical protein
MTMNRPMPLSLEVNSWFKVTDSNGRILRSEEVKAGADLRDRFRLAHLNYQLQRWTVDPLLPGRWSFVAEKAGRRIVIGIQPPRPTVAHGGIDLPGTLNQQPNLTQESGRHG